MRKNPRTKTFTGCWTCRNRKIKCDQTRPQCLMCTKAKIECEGYSIKLQWSHGKSKDSGHNERRVVGFAKFPKHMLYDTYEELDAELQNLFNAAVSNDATVVAGPFAVFQGCEPTQGAVRKRSPKRRKSPSESSTPTPKESYELGSPQDIYTIQKGDDIYTRKAESGFEQDLLDLFPPNFVENITPAIDTKLDPVFDVSMKSGIAMYVPFDEPYTPPAYAPRLLAQSHFLLWHYKHYITPIMTFIIHPKNPWRSIYLPRAYMAIGDIVAKGHTTSARSTLLYSFMAVSAFHLRNRYPANSAAHKYYNATADEMQNHAKSYFSNCLHGENIGKYKDLLVAFLSLVTLDLVKGSEGSGAGVSLAAAHRLITARYMRRPKMTRKVMILHRICVMLTLLQTSTVTCPEAELSVAETNDAWIDHTFEDIVVPQHHENEIEKLEKLESRKMPLSYMQNEVQLEEYLNQYELSTDTPDSNGVQDMIPDNFEAVSTQLIHGVPDSLVVLFRQVVKVSRRALLQRESDGHTQSFSAELCRECTQVEAALAQWGSQYTATRQTDLLVPKVNDAVMHHSFAFELSLIVYHYRMAKDVRRELLQPHIEKVIWHLEQLIDINKDGVVALPFFFPGFISACEVQSENAALRGRFNKWFEDMRSCGLSSYKQCLEIVDEVHRRRLAGLSSNWWEVQREWNVQISLL